MTMKNHSRFGVAALLCLLLSLIPSRMMADQLITYPLAKGAPVKHDFLVEVRQGDGKWKQVGTYAWPVDETQNGCHHVDTTSVASFDFTGSVDVKVTSLRTDVDSFTIRPLSYGIQATRNGRSVFFTLDRSRYLSVEVNGDRTHNLQIFANPVIEPVKKGRDIVTFKPGYYDLGKDSVALKSGQTLYIPGGVFIKGFVTVDNATDVRIIGTGIVNPLRQHEGILIRRSRNVEVNGPLTTQIPCGQSDSVRISDAKVISWYGWGDGMNVFASRHVSYNHVFCRTSDDCSTIYCTRLGYNGSSTDIHVNDAVYWADVAHPIMIGLHGNIEKNEEVTRVCYENIDILRQKEMQLDYEGCIAINDGDNILCHGLTFRNIHVEDLEDGMLVNFRVCYNKKYCHAPGRGIEDITIENLDYRGRQPNLSLITGYSEDRTAKNILFRNLTINGLRISDTMKGKPGWYKTADFARIFLGEHVSDVRFE